MMKPKSKRSPAERTARALSALLRACGGWKEAEIRVVRDRAMVDGVASVDVHFCPQRASVSRAVPRRGRAR
jgi:hypothetical protein